MATRYASGSLWGTDSNWGLTSGASDGTVPTATDDVIFDANSVSMAIDVNATCLSIDSTGFTATLTQNSGFTLTVGSGGLFWPAGTFSGGDSDIIISGGLSQTGGTFTSTSANLQFTGGNFTRSSGTFTHNSGTVRFDGNNQGLNLDGSDLFDLTISNGNPVSSFSILSNITINGKYFNESGGVAGVAATIVSLKGDAETRQTSGNVQAGPVFDFVGTGAQVLSANGATGKMIKIKVTKPSGTLTINDTIETLTNTGNLFEYVSGTVAWGTGAKIVDKGFTNSISGGSLLFNDVQISKGNSTTALTITGTLKISGDFAISACGSMNGGTVEIAGNLTSTDSTVGGTASITLNGTGAQTIDMSTGDLPNGTFMINKSSGTVTLLSALDLNGTGQDFVLAAGHLDADGFDITVNDIFDIDDTITLKGNETITAGTISLDATSSTVIWKDSAVTALITDYFTAYFNLTFGASKTHEFATGVGNGISVAGTLASNGTLATQSVLRAEADAAIDWELNLSGTSALVNKVNVKRSDASAGLLVSAIGSTGEGQNNTNWKFSQTAIRKKKKRKFKMTLLKPFEKDLTPGVTAVQIESNRPAVGVLIQAESANTGKVFVGISSDPKHELDAGEEIQIDNLSNTNQVWAKGAGAGDKIHIQVFGH